MKEKPVRDVIAELTDAQRAMLQKLLEEGPLIDLNRRDDIRIVSGPRPPVADICAAVRAAIKEGGQ